MTNFLANDDQKFGKSLAKILVNQPTTKILVNQRPMLPANL